MAKLRLLYVEDEPDIREIAMMGLNLDGDLDVRPAASGEDAWEILLKSADQAQVWRADAILLDLMMPGLDGMTLLSQLRGLAAYATTPVIFLTARIGAVDIERLFEAGAKGVITKPFDPMTLSGEVRSILKP